TGPSSVLVTWTAGSSNQTGFRVERRVAGGTFWWDIGYPGAAATSWSDGGLNPDTGFDYRVFATNAAGDSPPSSLAPVVTPPAAPSSLGLTASATGVDLAWTNNSTTQTQVRVERRL